MKLKKLFAILAALALPLIWGCEPSDPGAPAANQPPETRLVVAPVEDMMHDHYISPEVVFNVQWFGSDPDGQVTGYYLQVDDGPWVWTTRGDSSMAFESATPDPGNPGRTLPAGHTIRVKAVDDQGLQDATPAVRAFSATNYIPVINRLITPFLNGATVGQGIAFSVDWSDSNSSGAYFRLWVNNVPVTDWDSRSSYQFLDMTDPTMVAAVDSGAVKPVSITALPAGSRTLMVKVMDWGGAISDSATRTVIVVDTLRPLVTGIASTYDGESYYPDGSIFFIDGATTQFTITGSAASYFGSVQAFRYRLMAAGDSASWSTWGAGSFGAVGLAAGSYRFEAQCRDWAGKISDVSGYNFNIVRPTLHDDALIKVLIVDETRDGNGGRGSPNDSQVDSVWRAIFEYDTLTFTSPQGWMIRELDYTNRTASPVKYVSAKDVADIDLIVWHADDKNNLDLEAGEFNIRVLGEYLDAGGKLFLCGWDLLSNFTSADIDSTTFSSSSFPGRYLRITGGKRSAQRVFMGAEGIAGYPSVNIDAAKIPSSWNGALERCWTMTPSHRTETIATWSSDDALNGLGVAMKNFSPLNPWRTITCGFPVYFLVTPEAKPFVVKAVTELLAP